MNKTVKTIIILMLTLIFIVLSVIFGIYDLEISKAIANPSSPFGLTMEIIGELIAPYLFSLAGATITVYYLKDKNKDKKNIKIKMICYTGILFIIVGIGYNCYILTELHFIMAILIIITMAVGLFYYFNFIMKKSQDDLHQYLVISITTIVWLLAILIIVNIIKIFWGRVRFRDDLPDLLNYSPFYLPQGITGNRSFPSGHTSNASTLYILTMLTPMLKKKFSKALCYIIPILWIIVMAVSRVLVGAHFCSDVLYGCGISITLFYIIKPTVEKKMQYYLNK